MSRSRLFFFAQMTGSRSGRSKLTTLPTSEWTALHSKSPVFDRAFLIHSAIPPLSQKATLAAAARLQARSQRLRCATNLLRMDTGFPLFPHKRLLSNCRGQLIKAGIISCIQHTKPGRYSRSWLFLFARVWLYSQTVQSVCPCQIEKPFQAGPLKSACAPAKI